VAGAGSEVSGESRFDAFRGSMRDESVNEPVAAIGGDVPSSEAVAEQVVDVVAQLEVGVSQEVAADGAGMENRLSTSFLSS
jgi:hypothetical protein